MHLTSLNLHDPITIFFMGFYGFIFLILVRLVLSLWRARKNQVISAEVINESKLPPIKISSHDISAISGEDKLATQLDLARAYIETGRKQLAKKILLDVSERGDATLQNEAQRLMLLL